MKTFLKYSLVSFVLLVVLIVGGAWIYASFVPGDHSMIGLPVILLITISVFVSILIGSIKVGGKKGLIYFFFATGLFGGHIALDHFLKKRFYRDAVVIQKIDDDKKWDEFFEKYENPSFLEPPYDLSITLSSKYLPKKYMRKYSDSKHNLYLWALAANESLPKDVYDKLKSKNDPHLNSFLAKNPTYQKNQQNH